jgi:glycosidase
MKRYTSPILFLAIISILLSACSGGIFRPASGSPYTKTPVNAENGNPAWCRDAVFYEIFVRSFYDTNADGIGDFNGITAKLDYLQSLGITAIWLMPIHPSPSYHGYDVTDYYAVNPDYGTMDDFKRLLDEAHQRKMRVIIDFVINHTSDQHPWFVEANADPNSPYRDWYVWSDSQPSGYWHPGKTGYYYGYFWGGMPDLNYRNPAVTAEIEKITAYWLKDIGVDGFRVDAAKHLIEDGDKLENTPATHEWFKSFYSFYKSQKADAYVIGEVYGAGATVAKSYQKQLDQIFSFEMAAGILNSASGEANSAINSAIKFTNAGLPTGDFASFITNHDQDRAMSVFNGDVEKAKVAAALLFTAPGNPFIYYGEEIGMQGVKPDEDIRLPMQWDASNAAGFSAGTPWRMPYSDYPQLNVLSQENEPNSLLNHYRVMIKLRGEHSALRTGDVILLETASPAVYAIWRADDKEVILTLVNLTGAPVSDYSLSLNQAVLRNGTYSLEALFGEGKAADLTVSGSQFSKFQPIATLQPHSIHIFQIK